jgi:hypothetical protein
MLALPLGHAASAELTNYELQLSGGLAAVSEGDTYFFAPLEDGTWGLYSVKTFESGAIVTIKDVKPARLIYADSKTVYFLGIRPDEGFIFASVDLSARAASPVIEKLKEMYSETETTFFYVSPDDPYTMYRYSITEKKSTKIKNLTSKTMYDAGVYNKTTYLLGMDSSGGIVGYEINPRSNKAVNLSTPSPKMGDAYLFNGYIVYSQKGDSTRIYTVPVGKSKGVRLGEKISGITLSSPRYADALYPFDEATNSIVRVPLDGSATASLPLITQGQKYVITGGTSDQILYADDGKVYSISPQLQNKTELFEFDINTDSMRWTALSPTNQNHVLVMGYMPITASDIGYSLPTAVRLVDLASRETIFQFPKLEAAAVEDPDDPDYVPPENDAYASNSSEPIVDILVDENEDVSFSDLFGN